MTWPTLCGKAAFTGGCSSSAGGCGGATVPSFADAGGVGVICGGGGGLVVNDDKATLETLMVVLSVRHPFPLRICSQIA